MQLLFFCMTCSFRGVRQQQFSLLLNELVQLEKRLKTREVKLIKLHRKWNGNLIPSAANHLHFQVEVRKRCCYTVTICNLII